MSEPLFFTISQPLNNRFSKILWFTHHTLLVMGIKTRFFFKWCFGAEIYHAHFYWSPVSKDKHKFLLFGKLNMPCSISSTWNLCQPVFNAFPPLSDAEYSDPSDLQEKLERLNHIMSTSSDWASSGNYARRMQYLSNCEYLCILLGTALGTSRV